MVGRLYDGLSQEFGKEHVFIDICNIPLGADFREALEVLVRQADVMLYQIPLIRTRGPIGAVRWT
jgi:hypothetical protein